MPNKLVTMAESEPTMALIESRNNPHTTLFPKGSTSMSKGSTTVPLMALAQLKCCALIDIKSIQNADKARIIRWFIFDKRRVFGCSQCSLFSIPIAFQTCIQLKNSDITSETKP